MKRGGQRWHQRLLQRLTDRIDLGKDRLYDEYFAKQLLPKEQVLNCLSLLESEYQISTGLLRPKDSLEILFNRVPAKNPLLWLVYRTREDDSRSEINYQLGKRIRKYRLDVQSSQIRTLEDLVKVWCGKSPT